MRSITEVSLALRAENAIVSCVRIFANSSGRPIWLCFIPSPGRAGASARHHQPLLADAISMFALFWMLASLSDHRLGVILIMLLPSSAWSGGSASTGRSLYLSAPGLELFLRSRGQSLMHRLAQRSTGAPANGPSGADRTHDRARMVRLTTKARYWRNSESLWLHTLAVTKNKRRCPQQSGGRCG